MWNESANVRDICGGWTSKYLFVLAKKQSDTLDCDTKDKVTPFWANLNSTNNPAQFSSLPKAFVSLYLVTKCRDRDEAKCLDGGSLQWKVAAACRKNVAPSFFCLHLSAQLGS